MDTTKTYIKMCDCEEIQKYWYPSCGDFVKLGKQDNRVTIIVDAPKLNINDGRSDRFITVAFPWSHGANTDKKKFQGLVWLPRQDQLQEMVFAKLSPMQLLGKFNRTMTINNLVVTGNLMGCCSMEQLWLAFVMKEKYNKVWDGESWVC